MIELLLELIVTPILHALGMLLNVIFWSFCWLIVSLFRGLQFVVRSMMTLIRV